MSKSVSDLSLGELWELAVRSEKGLKLTTDDPPLLRQQLYQHKYRTKDARLDAFELGLREGGKELWIMRRKP